MEQLNKKEAENKFKLAASRLLLGIFNFKCQLS